MEKTFLRTLLCPTEGPHQHLEHLRYMDGHWSQPTFDSILMAGPPRCGKTSLLFEIAFTYAEKGLSVLFVSQSPIDNLPMYVGVRNRPQESALKRIEIVYAGGRKELLRLMSSIHIAYEQSQFSLVIIDNLEVYINSMEKATMANEIAQVSAYSIDAVKYFALRGESCSLVASTVVKDELVFLQQKSVFERWFHDILKCNPVRGTTNEKPLSDNLLYKMYNTRNIPRDSSGVPQLLSDTMSKPIYYKAEGGRIFLQDSMIS